MYKQLTEYLKQNNIRFMCDEPLCRHTTFRIGGNADIFICPLNKEQLSGLVKFLNKSQIKYFIIGHGSNLLVSDNGIKGAVISLENMKSITLENGIVTAQSGAMLSSVCTFCAENGLAGLEFAYGIPASTGGALYMNAGAYGGEMKDVVFSALCMDQNGEIFTVFKEDMQLSYRYSMFKQKPFIILSVAFKLINGEKEKIKEAMNNYFSKRKEKQPLEYGSAGSTFKRPEGYFAGALIEQSGLKGVCVGDAEVSVKHAGFVINKGSATCRDVLELIEKVKTTVYNKHGVMLEPEVIFVGE